MQRFLAGLCIGLGAAAAAPALAQDGDDGVVAMCLARGESPQVCGCASEALKGELGGRYGQLERVGAAFAEKVAGGMAVSPAWGAALDAAGLGRIQAGPLGAAEAAAIEGCRG